MHLKVLENYLSGDNSTCFESYNNAKAMTEAFPFPVRIMQMIEKEENGIPDDVRSIFKAMITLKREYSVLARERAMVRKKNQDQDSPPLSAKYTHCFRSILWSMRTKQMTNLMKAILNIATRTTTNQQQ